ncbi:YtxH domain-containing protein [Peptococcaceae bacterium 1198_IL3148]
MRGFWSGMVAGSVLGAVMSMYMEPKNNRNIIGPRRRKQANRMMRGVSHRVQDLMK